MAGPEHYLIGDRREAVTPYIFVRPLSVEDVMLALGSSVHGDSAFYHADAEGLGLIKALRAGQVKAGAINGSQMCLLPPAFWKLSSATNNAFTKSIIDTSDATESIPGLKEVQGWRVFFDETSFGLWQNPDLKSQGAQKIKRPTVSLGALKKFLRKDGKKPASRDVQWKRAKKNFPNHNVPRAMVDEARESIWGRIPRGPRKRSKT